MSGVIRRGTGGILREYVNTVDSPSEETLNLPGYDMNCKRGSQSRRRSGVMIGSGSAALFERGGRELKVDQAG